MPPGARPSRAWMLVPVTSSRRSGAPRPSQPSPAAAAAKWQRGCRGRGSGPAAAPRRAGQHGELPAVGVDGRATSMAERARPSGDRRTRRHDEPPAGRIVPSGHDRGHRGACAAGRRRRCAPRPAGRTPAGAPPHRRTRRPPAARTPRARADTGNASAGRWLLAATRWSASQAAGRRAPVAADPPPGERVAGERGDGGGHPLARDLVEHRGGHPQHPSPVATASAFAACRSTTRTRSPPRGAAAGALGGHLGQVEGGAGRIAATPAGPCHVQCRRRVTGEAALARVRSLVHDLTPRCLDDCQIRELHAVSTSVKLDVCRNSR